MSMLKSCMPSGRGKSLLIPVDEEEGRRKLTFRAKSLKWIFFAREWKRARKKGEGGSLSHGFLRGSGKSHTFYYGPNSRDLTRRNEGRTISKVKGGGGGENN